MLLLGPAAIVRLIYLLVVQQQAKLSKYNQETDE